MTHFFKHLSLRIWVTILTGGLITLYMQPYLHPFFGIGYSVLTASFVFIFIFFITGYLFNKIGNSLLKGFIKEAASLERFGKNSLAEKTFRKALTVYDSFLRSPFTTNKNTVGLKKQIAQFYTAGTVQNQFSESFIISYLTENPGDKEIARRWLSRHDEKVLSEKKYHEITGLLSETYPKSLSVQAKLSKVFLYAMRTDFTALNTYKTVIDANKKVSDLVLDELARIFIVSGRADDHALEIYIRAWKLLKRREQLAGGLYACLKWVPETDSTRSNLIAAKMLIKRIDPEDLDVMLEDFKKPELKIKKKAAPGKKSINISRVISLPFTWIFSCIRKIGELFKKSVSASASLVRKTRKSNYTKPLLKWGAVLLTLSILTFFLSSTVIHLFKKQTPEKTASAILKITIDDPFTIQVAAYRKEENARKYVSTLKKAELDAYYIIVLSSQKKWYQVRISHFKDKNSAREYGLSLKKRGLIKDFYVANYQSPSNNP